MVFASHEEDLPRFEAVVLVKAKVLYTHLLVFVAFTIALREDHVISVFTRVFKSDAHVLVCEVVELLVALLVEESVVVSHLSFLFFQENSLAWIWIFH